LRALLACLVLLAVVWFMDEKMGSGKGVRFVTAAFLPLVLGLNRIREGLLRAVSTVVAGQLPTTMSCATRIVLAVMAPPAIVLILFGEWFLIPVWRGILRGGFRAFRSRGCPDVFRRSWRDRHAAQHD
jgi:hypothetical protein